MGSVTVKPDQSIGLERLTRAEYRVFSFLGEMNGMERDSCGESSENGRCWTRTSDLLLVRQALSR